MKTIFTDVCTKFESQLCVNMVVGLPYIHRLKSVVLRQYMINTLLGLSIYGLASSVYADQNQKNLHDAMTYLKSGGAYANIAVNTSSTNTHNLQQITGHTSFLNHNTVFNQQAAAAFDAVYNKNGNKNKSKVGQNTYANTHINTNLNYSQTIATGSHSRPILQRLNVNTYPVGRPTLSCITDIANKYNLPVDLMLGIQSTERGNTGQAVRNSNGTYDLGAFQINTIHLQKVSAMGGTKQDALSRGCFNTEVAAFLLATAMSEKSKMHLDYFSRASGYHSWTPKYNSIYRKKLQGYVAQWQRWLKSNNLHHLISAPDLTRTH